MPVLPLALMRMFLGFGVLFPAVLAGVLFQAAIIGPVLGDRKTVPRLIFRATARLFSIRVQVNSQSLLWSTDRPVNGGATKTKPG